jgi:Protein of unknown function (DUF2848)
MLQFLCLGLSQVKTVEFSANQVFIEPILSADSPANQVAEYQVSANLLSQAPHIQVLGSGTAGSVAAVFLRMKDGVWLTVGSDHEDFTARTYSIAVAKQLCPKVLADQAWQFDEVKNHLDKIYLRSWVIEVGKAGIKLPYQDALLEVDLTRGQALHSRLENLAVGGVLYRSSDVVPQSIAPKSFVMQLFDPILNRTIQHRYDVECLEKIN